MGRRGASPGEVMARIDHGAAEASRCGLRRLFVPGCPRRLRLHSFVRMRRTTGAQRLRRHFLVHGRRWHRAYELPVESINAVRERLRVGRRPGPGWSALIFPASVDSFATRPSLPLGTSIQTRTPRRDAVRVATRPAVGATIELAAQPGEGDFRTVPRCTWEPPTRELIHTARL